MTGGCFGGGLTTTGGMVGGWTTTGGMVGGITTGGCFGGSMTGGCFGGGLVLPPPGFPPWSLTGIRRVLFSRRLLSIVRLLCLILVRVASELTLGRTLVGVLTVRTLLTTIGVRTTEIERALENERIPPPPPPDL